MELLLLVCADRRAKPFLHSRPLSRLSIILGLQGQQKGIRRFRCILLLWQMVRLGGGRGARDPLIMACKWHQVPERQQ